MHFFFNETVYKIWNKVNEIFELFSSRKAIWITGFRNTQEMNKFIEFINEKFGEMEVFIKEK